MRDDIFKDMPLQYESIAVATDELSFNMASDLYTGCLLKTLVASKPSGRVLELGTGSGLATAWLLQGMDRHSKLVTVENNPVWQEIARQHLKDDRIDFVLTDGYEWLKNYKGEQFDLIFADAMPGKYDLFEEAFAILKVGGFYIVDDMLPQPNWQGEHSERVEKFINMLESRKDVTLTKLNWSTGLIICVKVES